MRMEALQYLTSVGKTGREKKPNIFLATFNVDKHRGVSCSSTKPQEPDADWTFSTNSLVVLSGGLSVGYTARLQASRNIWRSTTRLLCEGEPAVRERCTARRTEPPPPGSWESKAGSGSHEDPLR
ncbi:hypothetical protein NQZ68_008343 [Dissostichus eleginoides]|nr:hypothetical protein NQZ68_008343 [Dissostichus eleginoides]